MFDDTYMPIFNPKTNKFKYKKDPKKAKYAECPTCKVRIYHEQAINVVKCNTCGYKNPTTPNKTATVKKRCQICGKKRKIKEYVVNGTSTAICNTCMKGSE